MKFSRHIRFFFLVLVLIVAGLAIYQAAVAQGERDGMTVYLEAKAQAEKGDPRAIAAVEELERFLVDKGKSVEDLRSSQPLREQKRAGETLIQVEGIEPFFIKVQASAAGLKTDKGLESYINTRMQELHRLASTRGEQFLQVALTFNQRTSLERFWQLREQYSFQVDEVLLDVFSGNQWLYRYSRGLPDKPGEAILNTSLTTLLNDVRNGPVTEQFPEASFQVEVNIVKIRLPLGRAVSLSSKPDVLLVDPIGAWIEPYASRAVSVRLEAVPNPYMALVERNIRKGMPNQFVPPKEEPKTSGN
jgi:hypothetical protein